MLGERVRKQGLRWSAKEGGRGVAVVRVIVVRPLHGKGNQPMADVSVGSRVN